MASGHLTDEVRRFVNAQRLGFVATVNGDGTPTLSPKGTLAAWDDARLVFVDLASPGTVANLRERPAVHVNVVDIGRRRGYRFAGSGTVADEGSWFAEVVEWFERERGVRRQRARHVVTIVVSAVDELISPVYATGASEEEVLARWSTYWYEQWGSARPPGS